MYPLDNGKNEYTWNPNWIHPYESSWNIGEKLYAANVSANMYNNLIGTKINGRKLNYNPDIVAYSKGTVNVKFLKSYMKETVIILSTFNNVRYYLYPRIRYCPECAKLGYHSIFHQLLFFDTCIIHGTKLLFLCKCKNNHFLAWKRNSQIPFSCIYCGTKLPYPEISEGITNKWNDKISIKLLEMSKNIKHIYTIDPLTHLKGYHDCLTTMQCNILKQLIEGEVIEHLPIPYIKENNQIPQNKLIFLTNKIQEYLINNYGIEQCKQQFDLITRKRYKESYENFNFDIIAAYYLMGELLDIRYLDRIYPIYFMKIPSTCDSTFFNKLFASIGDFLHHQPAKNIPYTYDTYDNGKEYKTYEMVNYIYKSYAIIRYSEIRTMLCDSTWMDYPLNGEQIPLGCNKKYPVYIVIEMINGSILLY